MALGNWNNDQLNLNNDNPNNENDNLRGRAEMMVYVLCTALSHPPSILPISARMAWAWKIFVSFASFSSSIRRNLKVVTSSCAEAFIRYEAFMGFGAFFAIVSSSIRLRMLFSTLPPSENRHLLVRDSLISIIFL